MEAGAADGVVGCKEEQRLAVVVDHWGLGDGEADEVQHEEAALRRRRRVVLREVVDVSRLGERDSGTGGLVPHGGSLRRILLVLLLQRQLHGEVRVDCLRKDGGVLGAGRQGVTFVVVVGGVDHRRGSRRAVLLGLGRLHDASPSSERGCGHGLLARWTPLRGRAVRRGRRNLDAVALAAALVVVALERHLDLAAFRVRAGGDDLRQRRLRHHEVIRCARAGGFRGAAERFHAEGLCTHRLAHHEAATGARRVEVLELFLDGVTVRHLPHREGRDEQDGRVLLRVLLGLESIHLLLQLVDDDGDRQVDQDEVSDHVERDEVDHGDDLEAVVVGRHADLHLVGPVVACHDDESEDRRLPDRPKRVAHLGVLGAVVGAEDLHAHDAPHVQEQEDQERQVPDRGDGLHDAVDDRLQRLELAQEAEDAEDAQRAEG